MAEVTIGADILVEKIIQAAGGDPALARYRNPVLTVPDVTQVALDAAVLAYDPVAADDSTKDDQFATAETTKLLRFIEAVTFNHENRIRTLESLPPRTPAEYRDILKTIFKGLA